MTRIPASLFLALIVAVVVGVLFIRVFRQKGPWEKHWIFFLIVFLAAWVASLWVTPYGPTVWGVPLFPVVLVALAFALLLAAATPRRPPHTAAEAIHQERLTRQATRAAVGAFFWVFLVLNLIIIVRGLFM
jgi:uncharacterized membrane protein YfcA